MWEQPFRSQGHCLLTHLAPHYPLVSAEVDVRYSRHEICLFSPQAAPAGRPDTAAPAAVLCQLSREAWLRLAPLLRQRASGARRYS